MDTIRSNLEGARPDDVCGHLEPDIWAQVSRRLIRKAIAEFSHEALLRPELVDTDGEWGLYALSPAGSDLQYRFRARRLMLDHWLVETRSIEKLRGEERLALDALGFFVEFRDDLNIREAIMATYLDEISSTLSGAAYKLKTKSLAAAELATSDFQTIETSMGEGHPVFVANNGRIGFDALDYRRYAPEAASPVRLVWLAVHRSRAAFSVVSDWDYDRLLEAELGRETLHRFDRHLADLGLVPDDYLLMPAHPWQWHNRLCIGFVSDIADRLIVCLGYGPDEYHAQQSIRTFFNIDAPEKRYVKVALSILNMGFMRGLSPTYMEATPAINEWLKNLIEADPYLKTARFSIIREIAAIGYRNAHYETGLRVDTPYKKMLSALWRESPLPDLAPGERLMTMAALLHQDRAEGSVLAALIETSGLAAEDWIQRYLNAYLSPLIHCFYAYDLAFMPHGENLILVLEDHVPVRVVMKDIGEEIGILNGDIVLPEEIVRISFSVREDMKPNCIFTDVFDCFFRHLSALLVEVGLLDERRFWALVAECIETYQASHPEYGAKYVRYDLFASQFALNCLNRLQIANNQQMLDLADPEKSLQFIGTLDNPLAIVRQEAGSA